MRNIVEIIKNVGLVFIMKRKSYAGLFYFYFFAFIGRHDMRHKCRTSAVIVEGE